MSTGPHAGLGAAVLLFLLAAACGEAPSDLLAPGAAPGEGPAFHHRPGHPGGPGGGQPDPDEPGANIRTSWTFADRVGDKIRSDGRGLGPDRDAYVDGECGVSSIINVEGSGPDRAGDALLRTDWTRIHPRDSDACSGRGGRRYVVALDDPVGGATPRGDVTGGFANITDVEWVRDDEPRHEQQDPFMTDGVFNLEGCNLRMGGFEGTDPVAVTQLKENGEQIGWFVESTGDHVAMCAEFVPPGDGTFEGDRYRVPFAVTIKIVGK